MYHSGSRVRWARSGSSFSSSVFAGIRERVGVALVGFGFAEDQSQ
ncbi:hypothetical protein EDD99_4093 [Streptomyces sp. 846.5]|nr:hypothetical protein EDD99_4093 [Streptomyces sp. 846.5]